MSKNTYDVLLNSLEIAVNTVEHEVDTLVEPTRKNVLKRFPIFFTLIVTFGVSATFFGFERLLVDITYLNDRPLLILSIGILTLVVTGTLYKKL